MKTRISLLMFCILLLISVNFASAITGSIGNARMILRVEPREIIEKYILVKNVNNVSIDIELFASGDLEKDISIRENSFTLLPGQDKKAYFTINVKKEGTTESNINVKFTPVGGGNGVGLSSTIIIDAKEGSGEDWIDYNPDDDNDEDTNDNNSYNTVNVAAGNAVQDSKEKTNPAVIIIISGVIILLVLLIVLLMLILKKRQTKFKKEVKKK